MLVKLGDAWIKKELVIAVLIGPRGGVPDGKLWVFLDGDNSPYVCPGDENTAREFVDIINKTNQQTPITTYLPAYSIAPEGVNA